MADRDYRKFLKEGDRLNIRLIPRDIYVAMVQRHRRDEAAIESVFDDLFWMWDLNKLEEAEREQGREVSRADLAEQLISEMEDDDWWKTIGGFELHLQQQYIADPQRWADLLDPVYDMQERDGWIQRQ